MDIGPVAHDAYLARIGEVQRVDIMTIIAVKMYVFEQKPLHAPVVEVLRARLPYDGQRIVVHDFVRLDIEAPIARTGPQPHIGLLGIYHPAAVVGLRIPHGTDDSHFGFPVEDFQQFVRPVAAVAHDDDEFIHHGQYRPHALHHRKVVGHRILDKRKSANLHIVSLSFRPSGSGHENRRPPLSSPAGQR